MILEINLNKIVEQLQTDGQVKLKPEESLIDPSELQEKLYRDYGLSVEIERDSSDNSLILKLGTWAKQDEEQYLDYRRNEWDRSSKSISPYEVEYYVGQVLDGRVDSYSIKIKESESNPVLSLIFKHKDNLQIRVKKDSMDPDQIEITIQKKINEQKQDGQKSSSQNPQVVYNKMFTVPIVENHRNIYYVYKDKKIFPNALLPTVFDFMNMYHSKNQNFLRFFNNLDDDTKVLFLSYVGGMFLAEYARKNRVTPQLMRVEEAQMKTALGEFIKRLNIDAHMASFSARLKRAQSDADAVLRELDKVFGGTLEKFVGKDGIQHLRMGLTVIFMEFQFNQQYLMDAIKAIKPENIYDTLSLMKKLSSIGHRHAPSREIREHELKLHAISAYVVGSIMKVNPNLLLATIAQESNFRVHVHSLFGRGGSQQTDSGGMVNHFNSGIYSAHFNKYNVLAVFLTPIINSSMYADYARDIPSNVEGNILLQYYFASLTYIGKQFMLKHNVDLWKITDTGQIRELAKFYNGGPEKERYGIEVSNSPYLGRAHR